MTLSLLPFGCLLLRSVWKIRPGSRRGDYLRGHKIHARIDLPRDLCIDRKVGSGPLESDELLVTDHHFSEGLRLLVMAKGRMHLVEAEDPIDHRFHACSSDGSIHRDKLRAAARGNHAQGGDGAVEHIRIQPGCRAVETTDELDFALDRGRFDGLLQRSAANIDDLIDASTTGQLSHREMP